MRQRLSSPFDRQETDLYETLGRGQAEPALPLAVGSLAMLAACSFGVLLDTAQRPSPEVFLQDLLVLKQGQPDLESWQQETAREPFKYRLS